MDTRQKGRIGEDLACGYISSLGFHVKHRNYLKKWGELDIVAQKDRTVHFFEVKSVSKPLKSVGASSHAPEENVHPLKIRKIRKMVQTYFLEHGISAEKTFSFHVICVYMDFTTRKARIKWIKDIIL